MARPKKRRKKTAVDDRGDPLPTQSYQDEHDTPDEPMTLGTLLDRSYPWLVAVAVALLTMVPLLPSEAVAEGDGLLVVIAWLLLLPLGAAATWRQSGGHLRWGLAETLVAVLAVWVIVATLAAPDGTMLRPARNMMWQWIGLGSAFLTCRLLFCSPRVLRAVAVVMVALATGVATYGLYQYFVELPRTKAAYEQDPDQALRDAGIWFEPGSPERELFEQRLESVEPIGTFALTNSLAGFLLPWTLLALAVAFQSFQTRRSLASWIAPWPLLPLGLCTILTKSRSAYLALLVGVLAWGLIAWRSRRAATRDVTDRAAPARFWNIAAVAVLVVVVAIVGAVQVGGLDREVLTEAGKSLGYRLQYWQSTLRMIADAPWLGHGLGNFQATYTRYKLPTASEEVADPHNFVLQVAATVGVPGALLLLAALVAIFSAAIRPQDDNANTAPDVPLRFIFGGAAAGVLLAWPIGLTYTTQPDLVVLGLCLAALLLVTITLHPWVASGSHRPAVFALAAAVLLIHLLASGGVSLPGVALSLWLLLALAINAARPRGPAVPSWALAPLVVVPLVLLAACYTLDYRPVLLSRMLVGRAFDSADGQQAALRAAIEADPLAITPRELLVSSILRQTDASDVDQSARQFEAAYHELIERAPDVSKIRRLGAQGYRILYHATGDRQYLDKAIDQFAAAVRLYPNHAPLRADYAMALLDARQIDAFAEQRDAALRLDDATPHEEKKLSPEQRQLLERTKN